MPKEVIAPDLNLVLTPALLLDESRLQRNIESMHARMKRLGVSLRPHLKTAKSAEIARRATTGQAGGLTVSTLKEADYFIEHGFLDLTYAVGIVPAKIPQVAALQERGARINVITDSPDIAQYLSEVARDLGTPLRVLIEIESGGGRAGVLPESEDLLEIAKSLAKGQNLELLGVLTHAGHSYGVRGAEAGSRVAEEERAAVVRAAERMRQVGLPCPVVSAGSTPTAVFAEKLDGVTEMRPGVFMFYDLDQLGIGSCAIEDIALSVLASVIGHNRHNGHLLIDAGALALSKDKSAAAFDPSVGYGLVCDMKTLQPMQGLTVKNVHQEHGFVPVPDSSFFESFPVGSRVRILPNHACMTAAAYDRYIVLAKDRTIESWDRINGWDV